MHYQLQYNICAVILYLTVLYTHCSRKKTKERHNNFFTMMVVTGLIGCVVNIGNTYGNMHPEVMPFLVVVILDYIYFFCHGMVLIEFAIYSVSLTKNSIYKHTSLKSKVLLHLPAAIYSVLLVSNPVTESLFTYRNGVYERGRFQWMLYAMGLYYVTLGLFYVWREKKSTTRNLRTALASYFIVGCVTSFIQMFYPELLLQHFGFSVCELIILLNLQKPEEYIDSEFGVYNKSAFERLFRLNRNSGLSMEILMLNIEDFDILVQTVGIDHEKSILKEIADFIDEISEENTYYMGNRTFYIMKKSGKGSVDQMMKDIDQRFRKKWGNDLERVSINYKMLKISVPEHVKNLDALYSCNANFNEISLKNGCVVDIKDVDFDKVGRRLKVEKLIKKAINEDNFQIYYQPIYSIKEKKIVSAEALIRLIDPKEGFVSPAEFIPIAEKNGSIIKIGEIVFDKVFHFIKHSDICELGIEYVEINLSVVQCMQKGLAKRVIQLIDSHGIDKKNVNLEITETAAADSPKILLENMIELSNEEITFSLDDFGTGYSNISSLMSMPLDIIKFDKSMIDMAGTHEYGKNVIDSSVAMVKGMGLKIVAEGIEQQHQLDMLEEMGVDYIQGYYFSKPLPEKEFVEYLKKQQVSAQM